MKPKLLFKQTWVARISEIFKAPDAFNGLTIWPYIFFTKEKERVSDWLYFHEEFHFKMQARWLVVPRWIVYGLIWLKTGYTDHPWEKAADDYADQKIEGGEVWERE